MARRSTLRAAIGFLANPYVVLVDVLIATFFVVVLYVHSVRIHTVATTDPKVARIRDFKRDLKEDLQRCWGRPAHDESQIRASSRRALDERQWWTTRPADTELILKQDATSIKFIPYVATEAQALFAPGRSELTARGEAIFRRLVACLGRSQPARELLENAAILTLAIEGHTGEEGRLTDQEHREISVRRALQVSQILDEEGRRYDAPYVGQGRKALFSPGRFSIIGRGQYLRLPFIAPDSPIHRRVQVEIRFTDRYKDQSS